MCVGGYVYAHMCEDRLMPFPCLSFLLSLCIVHLFMKELLGSEVKIREGEVILFSFFSISHIRTVHIQTVFLYLLISMLTALFLILLSQSILCGVCYHSSVMGVLLNVSHHYSHLTLYMCACACFYTCFTCFNCLVPLVREEV